MPIPDKFNFSGTPQQLTEMLPMAELIYQFLEDFKATGVSNPFIALPIESVEGLPQIQLWFREAYKDAKADGRADSVAHAQLSFRIKAEDESDWRNSETEAKKIARKISSLFAEPIFSIHKGENKFTYWDKKKAYKFVLYVTNEGEARRILTQLFKLLEDTPNWQKLTFNKSEEDFKTKKNTKVLGETVPIPDRRPITTVHFQYAVAKIPPRAEDIGLVDTVGALPDAYIRKSNPLFGQRSDSGGNHAAQTRLA